MNTKSQRDGYLLIDESACPQGVFAPKPMKHEMKTFTCAHCNGIVVMEPRRTRERAYCRRCDGYICDHCALVRQQTLTCKPFTAVVDELLEAAERQAATDAQIILP